MKFRLIIFILIGFNTLCIANPRQGSKVNKWEFEISTGATYGGNNEWNAKGKVGLQLLLEYRYYIPETKFSFGQQFSSGYFIRVDDSIDRIYRVRNKGCTTTYLDYNISPEKGIFDLFCGAGAGLAAINYDYPQWESGNTYSQKYLITRSAVFSTRFGIKLYKRLRLTAEYRFMKKEYSYFGFNIGISIIGKP